MKICIKNKKLIDIVNQIRYGDAESIELNKAMFSAWIETRTPDEINQIVVKSLCDQFLNDHPHLKV